MRLVINVSAIDLNQFVDLLRFRPRPDASGDGLPDEVDCRDALLTAGGGARRRRCGRCGALLEACRDDPARFQAEVLGRRLWAKQVEVCQAIAQSPITVVPAGRAVGKSFLLAGTGALVALHPAR